MYQQPNVRIRVFRKRWGLILGCFFPVGMLNNLCEPPAKRLVNSFTKEADII